MKFFFTADQHFGHKNIIKYNNRPFNNIKEMDSQIIENHNSVVTNNDMTIHIGDFCFLKSFDEIKRKYLSKLNGNHKFVKGNHDYWAKNKIPMIIEQKVDKQLIVCCHYSMNRWNKSHYGSWHLFGHSHGNLIGVGQSFDVGVDCNNYTPVSFEQVTERMKTLLDNPSHIKRKT